MSTYQHIAQRQAHVPVSQLCQVLRVAPAACYTWQRHGQQPTAKPGWQVAVREAFACHSQRYGTRRLRAGGAGPRATPGAAGAFAAC